MLFSAFSMAAVGRTAQEVVTEVREQFVNKAGILAGTVCAPPRLRGEGERRFSRVPLEGKKCPTAIEATSNVKMSPDFQKKFGPNSGD